MAEGEPTDGYCSSSGEEDGDAAWRAAIRSIVQTTTYVSSTTKRGHPNDDDDAYSKPKTQQLKHSQLKAQKLLNEILENTIEIVRKPIPVVDEDPKINECGIRLFKHAQPGIGFDHVDEPQPPRKRPRIRPGEDIDEKSKKFRKRIRSVAVNGIDVVAAAHDSCKKSLARLEAKDAAAKAKAKREEERVENLKKIRGERWLPSMAKEMQVKIQR
ncbi:unnamed protein product [Sphenostylis stenocarpa]|uniref:Uncharacterized protein n=1 Tax=Sphenostylis stenocarpa TaxID=92480 RepID=A0AA86SC58_9FABA|nr:unnamed protein product [Sphenostylis stenocarpa]